MIRLFPEGAACARGAEPSQAGGSAYGSIGACLHRGCWGAVASASLLGSSALSFSAMSRCKFG